MNGDSNLSYLLEKMVQNLLNKFVVSDKTFRVSTPVGVDTLKRIFGNSIGASDMAEAEKHDGLVALFVKDPVDGSERQDYREKAQATIEQLKPYLGDPVIEVWQAADLPSGVFGRRSMYVCCIFALDESGFTNIVV